MTTARAFLRSLVFALLLAALTPVVALVLAPTVGVGLVLWTTLGAVAMVSLARCIASAGGRSARTRAADAALVAAALAFAGWLFSPGALGTALAAWGFGLVLAMRALLLEHAPGGPPPGEDAFEAARARALALLAE